MSFMSVFSDPNIDHGAPPRSAEPTPPSPSQTIVIDAAMDVVVVPPQRPSR